jgi:hypothetical protein
MLILGTMWIFLRLATVGWGRSEELAHGTHGLHGRSRSWGQRRRILFTTKHTKYTKVGGGGLTCESRCIGSGSFRVTLCVSWAKWIADRTNALGSTRSTYMKKAHRLGAPFEGLGSACEQVAYFGVHSLMLVATVRRRRVLQEVQWALPRRLLLALRRFRRRGRCSGVCRLRRG